VRLVLAVLFLASLSYPAISTAQERIETAFEWIEHGRRVNIYGGHVSRDRGTFEIGPGSSSVFGARLRTRVSSPLSLEIGFGLGSSERYVVDPRLPTGPAPVDTLPADWLLVEAGFQIALTGARTLHKLQPYILLTGGILKGLNESVSDSLQAAADLPFRYEIGTSSVFTVGFGIEWMPTDKVGVGLEVRDHLSKLNTPDGYFDLAVLEILDDLGLDVPGDSEWKSSVQISASLSYYF